MSKLSAFSIEQLEQELASRKAAANAPAAAANDDVAAALERAKQFPLQMRDKKGTKRINYSDLERWIKHVFGKEFCFVSTVECGNDSTHDFEDLGMHPDWLDDEEVKEVNAWLYGGGDAPRYSAQNLMEVLVIQGFLEKGDYIVEVSW
jgi:hypothetical protein